MPDIFAVYKPRGLTSNAVLNRLRRAAGTKKIGHAGTLDPLAEGMLVVGVGKEATKQLAKEVAKEKEYIASITLGMTSATDDEEGVLLRSDFTSELRQDKKKKPSKTEIQKVLESFTGIIWQVPPVYSAIKVNGKEAYKRIRRGEEIVMTRRRVEIKSITLESYHWPHLTLKVVTGPGVYIRALSRDIGENLGTGGYLSDLVRTRVGQWTLANALSLDEAEQMCVQWKHG